MKPLRERAVHELAVFTAMALLCTGLSACSDSASSADEAATVIVTTRIKPALIALRDGIEGDWRAPVAVREGRYELEVHGPYTVEVVCVDGDVAQTVEYSQTPDDPRDVDLSCPGASQPTSSVTGTMRQDGSVALGTEHDTGGNDNWQFNIPVADGVYDLLAKTFVGDRLAIRRDVVVAGATEVSPIDVTAEGAQLLAYPITVTNLQPDEDHYMELLLATRSTRSPVYLQGMLPMILPDSALLPTDVQRVRVLAYANAASRPPNTFTTRAITRNVVAGGSASFTLPPSVEAVRFAVENQQLAVTWSGVAALSEGVFDTVVFGAEPSFFEGEAPMSHYSFLSMPYIRAAGVDGARLHTEIPGYEPAWRVDLSGAYERSLIASHSSGRELDYVYSVAGQILDASSQGIAHGLGRSARRAGLMTRAEQARWTN